MYLIAPQFSCGRYHVNVPLWMNLLKTDKIFRLAFDQNVFGLIKRIRKVVIANYSRIAKG
jgi:hypothetical protein